MREEPERVSLFEDTVDCVGAGFNRTGRLEGNRSMGVEGVFIIKRLVLGLSSVIGTFSRVWEWRISGLPGLTGGVLSLMSW